MKITAYKVDEHVLPIVPGRKKRWWMEETSHKYAYRCLPLPICNTTGWEILSPCDFIVRWNGEATQEGLEFFYEDTKYNFLASAFGWGIVTIHSGYLFKTSPGWDILVRGSPNWQPEWMYPLSGIVETWWLPFTFTLNWKLHQAGEYRFFRDDPLGFILPIPHDYEDIEPEIKDISENPELEYKFNNWSKIREQTIAETVVAFKENKDYGSVKLNDPKTHWEATYMKGLDKEGNRYENHITNRKFPEFKEVKDE
jgi:hypothetical protein